MFITVINDCRDQNAMARQATRLSAFLDSPVTTVGIAQNELEAAGNLIDVLDASGGNEGVVLVNVAPRQGRGKKWPNGTPFCYFYHKKTLIVSSIAEHTLSLAKKFSLLTQVYLLDASTVIDHMIKIGNLDASLREQIVYSQFRSYEFTPRVASWIMHGIAVPSEEYAFDNIEEITDSVWFVDNFGNCKTTLIAESVDFAPGKSIHTSVGDLVCYEHLKDIPNSQAGIVIGSSGYGTKRFLEIIIQGQSASEKFNLQAGSPVF